MITVLQRDEALRDLEKVRVGFVWSEVHLECEGTVWCDLLLCRQHLEWILHKLVGSLIEHRKECPIDSDREAELILHHELSRLTQAPTLREVEVNIVLRQLDLSTLC